VPTSAKTIIWYKGDTGSDSARETAPVQVGDSQSVAIGVRADESGFQAAFAAFGAMAVESFPQSDSLTVPRFHALSQRASGALLGTTQPVVSQITTDLANASITLGNAAARVSASKAQVQNGIDSAENADPTEVAAKLMALQTKLQASYQMTASIAKLSLTDYIS
jgi:flagellar hook-associated protein 3 FlgL